MATASKPTTQPRTQTTAESVRETLESIVVAFILAFVFRAFIVEAFVIPTGSMAPTLYGAQIVHTCSVCGYEYARSVSLPEAQMKVFNSPTPFRCPNCDTATDPVQEQRPNSGDRILVHKWPFNLPFESLHADRWEVIVFKDPSDGTTNYIKRCVGLPGEILEIIDGDIYTAPLAKVREADPTIIEDMLKLRAAVYDYRVRHDAFQQTGRGPMGNPFVADDGSEIVNGYAEVSRRLLPLLEIRKKTPKAQKSLWFNVYNQDYLPNYSRLNTARADQVGWHPDGAAAEEAWDASSRRVSFESESDEWLALEFGGKPIVDFIAYNEGSAQLNEGSRPVGDLRLRLTWRPISRTGGLQLELTRDLNRFVATIMADGTYSVLRYHPSEEEGESVEKVGEGRLPAFDGVTASEVEFSQADYRVTLRINGETVATRDFPPSLEKLRRILQAYRDGRTPNLEPSHARIAAKQGFHELRHVELDRDVFYRSDNQSEPGKENIKLPGRRELIRRRVNPFKGWPGWGTANMPILLRDDGVTAGGEHHYGEYFMCGDNSPASKDSRLWWEVGDHLVSREAGYRVGTVPEDQLIGEAFFVYWPSGYRRYWAGYVGLVPNFGRIRWIR